MTDLPRRWNVVSTSPSFGKHSDDPVLLLENAGCEVRLLEKPSSSSLDLALREADAWIAGFEPVGETLLSNNSSLRVAAKCGAGLDNFDLDYLARQGITVVSVPGGNSDAVAEYTMGQILALARGIIRNDYAVRSGHWGPYVGEGLAGKCLGVIGYGAIGAKLSILATTFGMSVVVCDPFLNPKTTPESRPIETAELHDLLSRADFVSLHVPLNNQTRGLIGQTELKYMQPKAYLINNSRGGIVDEDALYFALMEGKLGGAALDVFDEEPMPSDYPLISAPNLLLSPHTAGYSDTALLQVTLRCAQSLIDALERSERRD